MIRPLMLSRNQTTSMQRFGAELFSRHTSVRAQLTEAGEAKWAVVLNLKHPVLPWHQFRVPGDVEQRAYWADCQGVAGLVVQPRVTHREQAPIDLVLFQALPPEGVSDGLEPFSPEKQRLVVSAWLDHLAQSFQRWEPQMQAKANGQAALGARLSGAAWALLSGRGTVDGLLSSEDLVTPAA